MLDVVLPILPQKIEAQAVGLEIDLVKTTPPEFGPLGGVYEAFEDRVLDTLAIILTIGRYPAEATAAFHRFGINIIGHYDQRYKSPREEGRVRAKVLAYRPCEQNRLDKRQ